MGLRPGGKVGVPFEARPIPASEEVRCKATVFTVELQETSQAGVRTMKAKLPDLR